MPKLSPKDMQAALAVAQKAFKEKFTPGFYHGSPSNKIEAFDPTKSVKDPMYITPKATFVTRDPEFAESFLSMNNSGKIKPGSTMYPVNVNLGQHWHPDTPEGQQLIQEFIEKYPKRAGLQKGLNRGDWTAVENSDFLTHLKDTGHDTFHVMEGGVPNVGVLKPENIRGKFAEFNPEDAADPDFMKAEGGEVQHMAGGRLAVANEIAKLARHPHGQDPKVAQALEQYLKGNISQEERIRIMNQFLPTRQWKELPPNYSDEEIRNALMSNKQPKALAPVPEGMRVGNRLDIPAYTQKGVYVDTTHDTAGKPISYGRTGHLKDVEFGSNPDKAVRVGLGTKPQALTPMAAEHGADKSPFALIKGTHQGTSDEEVRRMMAEMMQDPNYTQIGMDPRKHSQFYDKSTGMPVWSAEEKLQSGPLILAPKQGLETTSWDDPRLNLSDFEGKQYADGGLAHLARGGMLRRGTTYGTPQQQAVNYIAPKPLQATTTAFNKMPSPTPVTGGSTTMPGTPPMVPVQKPVVPIQNSKTAATSTVPAGGATFAQAPTQQPLPTPLPTPTPNPDQAAYQTYLSGRQGQNNMSYGDWSTWNTNYNNQDPGYQAYLKSNQGGGTDANGNAMASLTVMPMTYGDWKQYSQPSAMSSPNTGNGNSAAIYDPTGSLSQPGTPSGPSGSAGTGGIASLINSTQQLPGSLTMNVQAAPQQPQPPQPPTQINSVLGNLIGGTIPGIAAGKAGGRVQHFEFGGAVKKALQYARTVPFTHFSHSSNISRLEPSLYGSGIKGAEASRLKDAPDIKPRSYIYVSKENVRPEQGLGPHRYEGVAENMYPLHEDPAGFSAKARELAKDPYFAKMGVEIVDQPKHLNELERQIKNAGYSGYADDNVGLLFNPTDVTKITD